MLTLQQARALGVQCHHPDTCGCELHYSVDAQGNEVPLNDSYIDINGEIRQTTLCQFHSHLTDIVAAAKTVLVENKNKNKVLGAIITAFPALTQLSPEGHAVFKNGVIDWSFDANRKLVISTPSLNTAQKATLQTLIDNTINSKT